MSAQMTEAARETAPEVFRLRLPRRGAKAKGDRLFLGALHCFTVRNIAWRALPERFGRRNAVWRRFRRLSRSGVFGDLFAALADLSGAARPVRMFASTGGEAPDNLHFETPIDPGPDVRPRAIGADKGYDSAANRRLARNRGSPTVIPCRKNAGNGPKRLAKALYRGRARLARAVAKLKRFKRIDRRCEKTAANFSSFAALAAAFISVESIHRA